MISDVLASAEGQRLLRARLIASLGSLRGDGSIHIVPMWFLWDGEAVLLPTSGATAKSRNLARDPRASVMIHDSKGAFDVSGISMSGRIDIVDAPESLTLNRAIHLRYITEEGLALKSVASVLAGDDLTLRFRPERASIWDMRRLPGAHDLRETGLFEELEPTLLR